MTHQIEEQKKTDKTLNNLNGINMYGRWETKWLSSKTRRGEFDYSWQNISDSYDMENILHATSLVTKN
jgi:hypothetical protein